ncbi:PAS domain-containing protein [Paractinoplanes maris]|uniref:PAS domain-containing protein n=1 Tax=Paractinoplanes maris TaxID=1734446 RepID=UPI00201FD96C|nr:PAS domain-containing protein [Actinoplanes maris]
MFVLVAGAMLRFTEGGSVLVDRARLIDLLAFTCSALLVVWVFVIADNGPWTRLSPSDVIGSLLLTAVALRLNLATGRNVSALLLLAGSIGLLAGDVLFPLFQSEAAESGYRVLYIAWGLAALHPSMVRLTQPMPPALARWRGRWAALLGASVATPPIVLLIEALDGTVRDGVPIAIAGAITLTLTITRLADSVTLNSHALARERGLRSASADLVSAADIPAVDEAVRAGVAALIPAGALRSVVFAADDRQLATIPLPPVPTGRRPRSWWAAAPTTTINSTARPFPPDDVLTPDVLTPKPDGTHSDRIPPHSGARHSGTTPPSQATPGSTRPPSHTTPDAGSTQPPSHTTPDLGSSAKTPGHAEAGTPSSTKPPGHTAPRTPSRIRLSNHAALGSPSSTKPSNHAAPGGPSSTQPPGDAAPGTPDSTQPPSDAGAGGSSSTQRPAHAAPGTPDSTEPSNHAAPGTPGSTHAPSDAAADGSNSTQRPGHAASGAPDSTTPTNHAAPGRPGRSPRPDDAAAGTSGSTQPHGHAAPGTPDSTTPTSHAASSNTGLSGQAAPDSPSSTDLAGEKPLSAGRSGLSRAVRRVRWFSSHRRIARFVSSLRARAAEHRNHRGRRRDAVTTGTTNGLSQEQTTLVCPLWLEPLAVARPSGGALVLTGRREALTAAHDALEVLAGQAALALDRISLVEAVGRRDSDLYLRAVISNTADLMLVLDDDQRIRYASPALHDLLGDEKLSPLATLEDLVHPDDRGQIRRALATGGDGTMFCALRRPDHSQVLVEATYRDLRADRLVQGFVLTLQNVTETQDAIDRLPHRDHLDELPAWINRRSAQHKFRY